MSVRKPYNRPRDGGISWATASAGDTYCKNPTRNICQVEDNEIVFLSKDTHCLWLFEVGN